ncbi:MAG: DUF6781 family protein, partial [Phycisphaeraceae bacterium]|nr:DUF6781 family protein [Phycisphaeraceae bacterium]
MNESNQSSESESLKERARKIVESGEDVRERIRKLLVDGVREGRLSREELADATEHIIEGAVGAADDASSPHLREVIDGLSEGYQAAAHATRLAVEEAASQGSGFAREQTQQVIDDLRTLDELLVETLQRTASAVIREADEAGRGLVEHARRAAQRIKDPVARAIRTLQEHPVDTASEAAAAGTRAAG